METTFAPLDVVATAQAIYREQGYIKKNQVTTDKTVPNSTRVRDHFTCNNLVTVSESDYTCANEIVNYLTGLSFKAMERGLTEFETNVLKFVTSESVTAKELGMAASLPQVYDHKLKQDQWEVRERELAVSSDFTGTVNKREAFELTIENVRYIGRTGSYLYCTSTTQGNIVKFFFQSDIGGVGDQINLTGYIKSHGVSKFHGGKETMINRIKLN